MNNIRIAIVGAGPAGLTLARLLQINKFNCTVFELDDSEANRDQGGTVDLHGRGGQRALKEAGLIDEFKKYSRPEAEMLKLIKFDGTVVLDENKAGNTRPEEFADRPEIDRKKLRHLLFESLQAGTVVWGRKLKSVEESSRSPGKFDLHFQSGVEQGFDLVVGADGAWSKVRSYLTSQQPVYSGITAIELWALEIDKKHQWLAEFVGEGNCFMFDEGRAIQCQKNGDNSIRVYVGLRQPEKWLEECGIDWSSPEEARKSLIERYYDDCSPDLKRAVTDSKDQLVPRILWMLPIGMKWDSRPGVTLIGDAAHLMTPFAGVGVNLAMVDALDLATAIVGCEGDLGLLPHAIKSYESEMLARGEQFARKTWKGLENHFSAGGCEEMAKKLQKR